MNPNNLTFFDYDMTLKTPKTKCPEKTLRRFVNKHGVPLTTEQFDELLHMIGSLVRNREYLVAAKNKRIRILEAEKQFTPNTNHKAAVNNGLRMAIRSHGPVTAQLIENASKIIMGQLLSTVKEIDNG